MKLKAMKKHSHSIKLKTIASIFLLMIHSLLPRKAICVCLSDCVVVCVVFLHMLVHVEWTFTSGTNATRLEIIVYSHNLSIVMGLCMLFGMTMFIVSRHFYSDNNNNVRIYSLSYKCSEYFKYHVVNFFLQ